ADCDNIVWGTACADDECDNIVWGTACDGDAECDNLVWGNASCGDGECDNIVWGTTCGDGECDNIVWGTADLEAPPIFDDPDVPSVFVDVPFETLFGNLFAPAPVTPPAPPPGSGGTNPGGGIL